MVTEGSEESGAGQKLLTTIKRKQLEFLAHITRAKGLKYFILISKKEGKRSRGRHIYSLLDNSKRWNNNWSSEAETLHEARNGNRWRAMIVDALRCDT